MGDATPRRPAFAAGFPSDPKLDELVAAFERGDYARVRSEAPRLAAESADPAVQRAAKELRARIDPDRLAVWMLVATGAILAVLTAYWIARAHEPPELKPPRAAPSAPVTVEHVK